MIRVPSMRRRFVAFVIDFFIASFLLTMGLGAYVTYVDPEAAGSGAILVLAAVVLVTNVLPVAFAGGSLGQLALGLRVARLDGRRLSVPHTLVRLAIFLVYFPLGAVLGGFIGVLAAGAAGATGDAVAAALIAGALFGLLAWVPLAIVSNVLGLAAHDAISRSIVVGSGEARPFAAALVPRSANRPKRGWAGIGAFVLAAYLVATSALAPPPPAGDLSAGGTPASGPGGAPAGTDVVVTGTVYVPKGQELALVPLPGSASAGGHRPPGLAAPAASWCSATHCDVLAGARVRFVAPSRSGWQALADAPPTTADAQGSYRMVLPARYAAPPAPVYVMATDPAERLAVLAEVVLTDVAARNQLRSGVGITQDLDHSTTYLALLRCPGGGTAGTCGSSAGDPSVEQLERAMAARFTEQGGVGDLRTPAETVEALVAWPAVVTALEAGVAYGSAPSGAPAAIVAATKASPPLAVVADPKSPPPSPAPPRAPPAAVQQPPAAAPPAPAPAGRPPTVEPGCPSVYDGTYIGQATYQVVRFVVVNNVVTERPDTPRALSLTIALKCEFVASSDVGGHIVRLDVTAAGADHPWFGALGVVAASGEAYLPLELPRPRSASSCQYNINVQFPSGRRLFLCEVAVPSFDASRIASGLGTESPWYTDPNEIPIRSWFPDGVPSRGGLPDYKVKYLTWSLTKTAR